MRNLILTLLFLSATVSISVAQTLFLPNGTSGIGTSYNGYVGIGTTSPSGILDIRHSTTGEGFVKFKNIGGTHMSAIIDANSSGAPYLRFLAGGVNRFWIQASSTSNILYFRPGGTSTSSQYINISSTGNLRIGSSSEGAYKLDVTENYSNKHISRFTQSSSTGLGVLIDVNGNSNITAFLVRTGGAGSLFSVQQDGNVTIGTTDPKGYKLAVAGKVIAEEVVVKLQNQWPDYVFAPNYNLRSLFEVEQHITTQGHLPEVPSAQQVEENGIGLAQMNALLLKKVEELTLYVIDLQKQVEALKSNK